MPNLGLPELLILLVPVAIVLFVVIALRKRGRDDSLTSPTDLQLSTPAPPPVFRPVSVPTPAPAVPAPPRHETDRFAYYAAGSDRKIYGPVSETTLREWLQERRIDGSTLVCRSGEPDWTAVRSHPGLRTLRVCDVPPGLPPLPPFFPQPTLESASAVPPVFAPVLPPVASVPLALPSGPPLPPSLADTQAKPSNPLARFPQEHPIAAFVAFVLVLLVIFLIAITPSGSSIQVGMTVDEVYAAMGRNPDWKGMSWEPGAGNVLVQRWGSTTVTFSLEGKVLSVERE